MTNERKLMAMLSEYWSNGACLGYAIMAMEHLGYEPEQIQKLVNQNKVEVDWTTLKEADTNYCRTRY